jgi:hypothetical protein
MTVLTASVLLRGKALVAVETPLGVLLGYLEEFDGFLRELL